MSKRKCQESILYQSQDTEYLINDLMDLLENIQEDIENIKEIIEHIRCSERDMIEPEDITEDSQED